MNVLVTGATGFAGAWLCRNLRSNGHTVAGWARHLPPNPVPTVQYKSVDIVDADLVQSEMDKFQPDQIFHLAALANVAECEADAEQAHEINVKGTKHVLDAAPPTARFVFASTCHVYGHPQSLPITEGHPIDPRSVYARTKSDAEEIASNHPNGVVIVRGFHQTGPGQTEDYVLANWAAQIRGGATQLNVGNINVARDFLDVRDVARGYALAAERGTPGEVYNLCSGRSIHLHAILEMMVGARDISVGVEESRVRAGDVLDYCGDPSKIKALGWAPRITLHESVADMLDVSS